MALVERRRVSKRFDPEKGQTRQEFQKECDINQIMARARREGTITHIAAGIPSYGDFTGFDFTEAAQALLDAQELFMSLPAAARKEFNNDASEFLDYMNDPASDGARLRAAGLLEETDEFPPERPPVRPGEPPRPDLSPPSGPPESSPPEPSQGP